MGSQGLQTSTIMGLAQIIHDTTKQLDDYLKKNNLPSPTFNLDTPVQAPTTKEYLAYHATLKSSLEDLLLLIEGPSKWLRTFCATGYDLAALQVALDFELFQHVPEPNGPGEQAKGISVSELAPLAGLDADRTGRIVRQLITNRIFAEQEDNMITHSPMSLAMHRDENLRAVVHYTLDEMLKAAADSDTALKAHPDKADQNMNPFVTRHGVGLFEFYKRNPNKGVRFAKAMAGLRTMDAHVDNILLNDFDWSALKQGGTVVDVGGGNGHISRTLADKYPHLNFIVQDANVGMMAQGKALLSEEQAKRVEYMQHDFFCPQPVLGNGDIEVAAFLIRQCTHNWNDEDAVRILRAFVPGLERAKPNTPLLINDIVLPKRGEWPRHEERYVRMVDMIMMVNCGAKQRTEAEFKELLHQADPRFRLARVWDNGPLGLVEVFLEK